jgi:hypothetical protein
MRSRFAMMNLFILSILVGAVLGMRLKVLVLVPATIFTTSLVVAVGAARGDPIDTIALVAAAIAICLQIGYISGSATRLFTAASRMQTRRQIPDSLTPPAYRQVGAHIDPLT